MEIGKPSSTAMAAALFRSLHLMWDAPPHVLSDPFAYPLLGAEAEPFLSAVRSLYPGEAGRVARAGFVVRHRVAEDELELAMARGTDQYLQLGAGLDSFTWRRPDLLGELRVFEVDHPSSQAWKRQRLAALGLSEPEQLCFVPVDFERDDLVTCLVAAGLDVAKPVFISLLGVSQYLTRESLGQSLRVMAGMAPGSTACIEYIVPDSLRDDLDRVVGDSASQRSQAVGEPWLSLFTPDEFADFVNDSGFGRVRHIGPYETAEYFAERSDGLRPWGLARLVVADN